MTLNEGEECVVDVSCDEQPTLNIPPEVVAAVLRQHASQTNHRIKIAPPPRFTGSADLPLDTWIFRMREYLGVHADTSDGIRTAASYLDGNAAIWWQSIATSARANSQEPFELWEPFASALREYLCPGFTVSDDALRRLLNLRQHTLTVSTYVSDFTNLRTRSNIADEATLQHLFVNGLEPVVQFEVSKGKPTNLAMAIHLAMQYEVMANRLGHNNRPARQQHYQQPAQPRYQQPRQQQQQHHQPRQQQPRQPPPQPAARGNGPIPMDLDAIQLPPPLTEGERLRLRDVGGCFRCRQIGHTKLNCPWYQGNGPRQ